VFTPSPEGDLIVVAGGETLDGALLSSVEAYKLGSNAWIGRTALPTPRSQLAMAAGANGRLYAVGGYAGLLTQWTGEVAEYDPLLDSWTQRAPMPTLRSHLALVQINGQLLAAGGENVNRSLDVLESYNPTANTWSSKTSSTLAFTRATAGVVNNRMLISGNALTLQYDPANEIR
jgi:N-acetylneuraminic acid mutarotase